MVINGKDLLKAGPIENMMGRKVSHGGVTHGLTEVGYDVRIKQEINFISTVRHGRQVCVCDGGMIETKRGSFVLASTIERFRVPDGMVAYVKDKSTWAREGLSVFNTVIEPGWEGHLTLELVFHGDGDLLIPAGVGIAQVVFHSLSEKASYNGKYQNQEDRPVGPRHE